MKHWTQYWKTANSLSSFSEGKDAQGYQGDVEKLWSQVLDKVEGGATVVDIGTGNGALALLVADYSEANNKDFDVHGTDAADINPVEQFAENKDLSKRLSAIRFHGNTRTEALPFADDSVDLIVSQFAFEYAEQDPALKEILRVLKPGGSVVMLAHHSDSAIMEDSKVGAKVLSETLHGTPLFMQADLLLRIARQYLENTSEEEWKGSQHGQATIKTTQWIMQTLRDRYSDDAQRVWIDDIIGRVARLMDGVKKEDARDRLQALAMQYDMLLAHQMRLTDQLQASYDKKAVSALTKAAEKDKAKAHSEPFKVDDNGTERLYAWKVVISK